MDTRVFTTHETPPRALWASPAGKARMARQLAALLPDHRVYVEPFAGSGAVLFAKAPAAVEVLGDVDDDIVAAFKAAQSLDNDGLAALQGSDWMGDRAAFAAQREATPTDDVGRLHRFLYLAHFSFLKRRSHFSPALQGKPVQLHKRLYEGVQRLRHVVVESGDYEAVVRKYDSPETAFFFDPPYLGTDGGVGEAGFDEARLLGVLKSVRGKFLLTYGSRGGALVARCKAAGFSVQQHFTQRQAPVTLAASGRPSLATYVIANYPLPAVPAPQSEAFSKSVAIVKQVPEERYLLGVVLEPDVVDAHDDIYGVDAVRKAAHGFMAQFRTMGLMHRWQVNDAVKILESYLLPDDMQVGETRLRKGTWMLGVRVEDDGLWAQVRSGELTGFSIGGLAHRQPLDAALSTKAPCR